MMQGPISKSWVTLAIGALLVLGSAVSAEAKGSKGGKGSKSPAGSYEAMLDLGELGTPLVETLHVVLNESGSVLATSEHDAAKESTAIGVWRKLKGKRIRIGFASFVYGPDPTTSICALVGVDSPEGNCLVKLGGTVRAEPDGSLVGEMFVTVETVDGSDVYVFPGDPPLPIWMRRLTLADFPGAP